MDESIYHSKDFQFITWATEMNGSKPIEVKREDDKITFVYARDERFEDILRSYRSDETLVSLKEFVEAVRRTRKKIFGIRAGVVR